MATATDPKANLLFPHLSEPGGIRDLVRTMSMLLLEAGADVAYVFAYLATSAIITADNIQLADEEDAATWDTAVRRIRRRHRKADRARMAPNLRTMLAAKKPIRHAYGYILTGIEPESAAAATPAAKKKWANAMTEFHRVKSRNYAADPLFD